MGAVMLMLRGGGGKGSKGKKSGGGAKSTPAPAAQPDAVKDYFGRLIMLIPAEVVSLYLVGIGVIPKDGALAMWIWAAFCLLMVFASRSYTTSDKKAGQPIQWPAVIIAAVSFCIWVYVSPGPCAEMNSAKPYIGSLLILAWTALVPVFYHPE